MSGETEDKPSSWTIDSLHGLILSMFEERDRRYGERFLGIDQSMQERDSFLERLAIERQAQVTLAFNASQKAIDKADNAYERRFEGQNEFREQLKDQARDFLPRKEYEVQHAGLAERVANIEGAALGLGGQSRGREQIVGYLIVAGGFVLGAIPIVIAILAAH